MSTKKKLLLGSAGAAAADGAGLDVNQVFSTFVYDGNGVTNVIENGINLGQSYGSGGINIDQGKVTTGTNSGFAYGTGDFTLEAWVRPEVDDGTLNISNMYIFDHGSGNLGGVSYYNGVLRYYTPTGGTKDSTQAINNYEWAHIAVSRSSGTTRLFYNGTAVRTQTNDTYNYAATSFVIGGYGGSNAYGWKGRMAEIRVSDTARYTSNFTAPTTGFTSDSNTILLAGQGSTLVDNGPNSIGLTATSPAAASGYGPFDAADAGEGGMVWIKRRDSAVDHHVWDTERGVQKRIRPNTTDAEATQSNSLTAFNSNGFTVSSGGVVNSNGNPHVAWTWRKAPKFCDVVQFTVGSAGTDTVINHSLGSDVGMVITKITSTTSNWGVHHRDLVSANEYMSLNLTASAASYDTVSFSSTQVDLGTYWSTNYAGQTGIAYIFAHHANDGSATGFGPNGDSPVISCGSYTGVSSTEVSVDCGFEPQWVMIKRATGTSLGAYASWLMQDVMRGLVAKGTDVSDKVLYANQSQAEGYRGNGGTISSEIQARITPTGFTVPSINSVEVNQAGETYIYMAIRRGPLAEPTSATDVFAIDSQGSTGDGNAPSFRSNFPVDMAIRLDTGGASKDISARLTGATRLYTDLTNAEASFAKSKWDYQNGWYSATSTATNYYAHMWKRAPSYFDVVAYSGNGTAGRTVSHNLGVAPEMMWVKSRSTTEGWFVYADPLGSSKTLELHRNIAAANEGSYAWNSTAPTSEVFTLGGTTGFTNTSGQTYIAYLFATLAGISKVGSYTGNGSTQNIDCGFGGSGARLVLIKRSDGQSPWWLWDSERGIVAGNDPYLELNSTAAENTSTDYIDPYSSGFALNSNGNWLYGMNYSGGSYIFYAIA